MSQSSKKNPKCRIHLKTVLSWLPQRYNGNVSVCSALT